VPTPRLFVCGGAKVELADPVARERHCVALDSVGRNHNVHIHFDDVGRVLRRDISNRLVDFLEIASYVYCADCATRRGGAWADDDSTEPWGRDLAFVIAVREPGFWGNSKVRKLIEEVLGFLSNDKYSIQFVPLERDRANQFQYFDFGDLTEWPFSAPERVLMFSGGLDSLAGAVETAASGAKSLLVSHRPEPKLDSRQKKLFSELKRVFPHQLFHVPVWINKNEKFGREPTQRTRSFLYSALGALVAESVHAGGVRFYENGVVSLNLPMVGEVLRARASRTTHPLALHLLSSLCSFVTERSFIVDNPYQFKTKAEVVASLLPHQATHLIAHTCSCSHSMFKPSKQRHCGRCSQCIDRRFAVTAANLTAHDPETDYESDVFAGPRQNELDRAIAVDYTRHGLELDHRSEGELAALFNAELSRAVRHASKRSDAAQSIIAMHKRHGSAVARVLEQKVRENAAGLLEGSIDRTSLLFLAIGEGSHKGRPVSPDKSLAPPSVELDTKLAGMDRKLDAILAKFKSSPSDRCKSRTRRPPGGRDTVIFAAITRGLKGIKYCSYLDAHRIKPRWYEVGPSTYSTSYQAAGPWRKKVQDEKNRAKGRMNKYEASAFSDACNRYLPKEFDEISLLYSRNSLCASKTSLT